MNFENNNTGTGILVGLSRWNQLLDMEEACDKLKQENLFLRDSLLNEEVLCEQHAETILELRAKIAVLKELLKEMSN